MKVKKFFIFLGMTVIAAYLVVAITAFNVQPSGLVCKDIELIIKDSISAGFVTKDEVANILKKAEVFPVGKPMDDIDSRVIKEKLASHPLVNEVDCYKTPGGKVNIEVSQRIPVLRVMARNGQNYYIDSKGEIMPSQTKCVANLAVATGHIGQEFARKELYEFALYLQKNKFWDAQIEQINILSTKEVELVPRVGDHIVFMGKMKDYEDKLHRLKEFYRKGLNNVGWNKYERINLEFSNQIICTKRD